MKLQLLNKEWYNKTTLKMMHETALLSSCIDICYTKRERYGDVFQGFRQTPQKDVGVIFESLWYFDLMEDDLPITRRSGGLPMPDVACISKADYLCLLERQQTFFASSKALISLGGVTYSDMSTDHLPTRNFYCLKFGRDRPLLPLSGNMHRSPSQFPMFLAEPDRMGIPWVEDRCVYRDSDDGLTMYIPLPYRFRPRIAD